MRPRTVKLASLIRRKHPHNDIMPVTDALFGDAFHIFRHHIDSEGDLMTSRLLIATLASSLFGCSQALAGEFSYEAVAERFGETRLDARHVQEAKMHGECLVGLKQLIFVKRNDFDPVAEWVNYRTISLLEQFPPCDVLIMMEVARKELMDEGGPS